MSPSLDTRENRVFAAEIKFLVSPVLAGPILDWARARLGPDPHAGGRAGDIYQITSLYCDTDQLDVFHHRGSFGRSKYRVRRYGQGQVAFLERKLKSRGLLTKRRSVVPLEQLALLSAAAPAPKWPGHWFHRRLSLRRLTPVCQIAYQRTARVAITPYGPIRLTLDQDLRALRADGFRFSEGDELAILPNLLVLELKFLYALPALFKQLVEEFALSPAPFSKYRLAAHALGLGPGLESLPVSYQPTNLNSACA